jgi:hypothetical protein
LVFPIPLYPRSYPYGFFSCTAAKLCCTFRTHSELSRWERGSEHGCLSGDLYHHRDLPDKMCSGGQNLHGHEFVLYTSNIDCLTGFHLVCPSLNTPGICRSSLMIGAFRHSIKKACQLSLNAHTKFDIRFLCVRVRLSPFWSYLTGAQKLRINLRNLKYLLFTLVLEHSLLRCLSTLQIVWNQI